MTTLKERFPQIYQQYTEELQRFSPNTADAPVINMMYHSVLDTDTEITKDWYSIWRILSAAGTAATLYAGLKARLPIVMVNAFLSNLTCDQVTRLYDELLNATKLEGEPESFLLNLQDFALLLNYSTVFRERMGARIGILERHIFYGSLPIRIPAYVIADYKKLYNIDNTVKGLLPQFK